MPARVPAALADAARAGARSVAAKLDYRGVLCVEFFVLRDGRLLANEIAPRPHNSGHYTIDACVTSQFEQQVRVLCGMPLGDTALHCPAVMVNLLGDLWAGGEPRWEHVLRHPAPSCTCTASARRGRAARWATTPCWRRAREEALASRSADGIAVAVRGQAGSSVARDAKTAAGARAACAARTCSELLP